MPPVATRCLHAGLASAGRSSRDLCCHGQVEELRVQDVGIGKDGAAVLAIAVDKARARVPSPPAQRQPAAGAEDSYYGCGGR